MTAHPEYIWQNGEFVAWDNARVHVMAHGLHYGSTVFEGIRCYATNLGPAIFKLQEHIDRLLDS
ncbi:MAG: branched chain amino acid aminotransferase, partial [Planctomycetota bacterium]